MFLLVFLAPTSMGHVTVKEHISLLLRVPPTLDTVHWLYYNLIEQPALGTTAYSMDPPTIIIARDRHTRRNQFGTAVPVSK